MRCSFCIAAPSIFPECFQFDPVGFNDLANACHRQQERVLSHRSSLMTKASFVISSEIALTDDDRRVDASIEPSDVSEQTDKNVLTSRSFFYKSNRNRQ
jgi:hypothetical protein